MKGKMAAESASCGILKGRTGTESASYSKILQNARKINGFSCQKELREAVEKVWPGGGPAEGAMAAYFASRKQIRLRLLHFGFVLLTLP